VVRDIFLFSCYTGLAYADVKKLKRSEIIIGVDGEQWLVRRRQKTDISARIPLLPAALTIINKYKDHSLCQEKDLVLSTCTSPGKNNLPSSLNRPKNRPKN
jgi:integrase